MPCTPWITTADLACVIPDDAPEGSAQAAVDAATEALYEASGRRFRGACERTVRPCRNGWEACWAQQLTPTTIVGDENGLESAWDACGCGWRSMIRLAGLPVKSIGSVTIDGEEIDASEYTLEQDGRLIRLDGQWPICQNMSVALDQPGSFGVTYTWGLEAPAGALLAASQLACELWAATYSPDVCRLPANVTQLVRQGVTIQRAVQAFNLRNGATGLPAVDAFLGYATSARPAAVYSPDLAPFPRPNLEA